MEGGSRITRRGGGTEEGEKVKGGKREKESRERELWKVWQGGCGRGKEGRGSGKRERERERKKREMRCKGRNKDGRKEEEEKREGAMGQIARDQQRIWVMYVAFSPNWKLDLVAAVWA